MAEPTNVFDLSYIEVPSIFDEEDDLPPSDVNFDTSSTTNAFDAEEEPDPKGFFSQVGSAIGGGIKGILDFISRGGYASATAADQIFNDIYKDKLSFDTLKTALTEYKKEIVDPHKRLDFHKLAEKYDPEYAKQPWSHVTTLMADIATDVTSYLGFGLPGKAIRILGKAPKALQIGGEIKEIGAPIIALSKKGKKAFGELLTKNETKVGEDVVRVLEGPEHYRSAEKMIHELIDSGHKELKATGGIRLAGVKIAPGLDWFAEKLASIPAVSKFGDNLAKALGPKLSMFSAVLPRNWNLPKEFVDFKRFFEAEQSAIYKSTYHATAKMVREFDNAELEELGKVSLNIREKAEKIIKDEMINPEPLIEDMIQTGWASSKFAQSTAKLKTARSIYEQMRTGFNRLGKDEQALELLDDQVAAYFPIVYDAVKEPGEYIAYRKPGWLRTFLSSSEHKKYETLDEAKAAGLVPEMNAAKLYALRTIKSRQAQLDKEFNNGVKFMFGVDDFEKLPTRIKNDIRLIGDGSIPKGLDTGIQNVLRGYDKVLNLFKRSATTLQPSFALGTQLPGNFLQSWAVIGPKAIGAFNPTNMKHVLSAMLADEDISIKGLSSAVLDQQFIRTGTGWKWTGAELREMFKKHEVLSGTSLSGEKSTKHFNKMLRDYRRAHNLAGDNESMDGLIKVLSEAGRWGNWAGHFEDFARGSLFLNALQIGHSPEYAAELMRRGLFDYSHGLNAWEKQIGKRIVPFLSFPRFAIPLVAKMISQTPGRVVNMDRTAKAVFGTLNKLYGGEQLSDTDRRSIPGWILEQPGFFAKYSAVDQAKFKTFRNFNFLDSLSMVEDDGFGNADWKATFQKGVISQLSPFIKAPFEFIANKNFFTDQVISSEKGKRVGSTTPEAVLANMVSVALANKTLTGALAMYATGQHVSTPDAIRDGLKKVLGWEEETDETGKVNAYINPWIAYAFANTLPEFNQLIRIDRDELSPTEAASDFLFGVKTITIDLAKARESKEKDNQKHANELIREAKKAWLSRDMNEHEQRQAEYEAFLLSILGD